MAVAKDLAAAEQIKRRCTPHHPQRLPSPREPLLFCGSVAAFLFSVSADALFFHVSRKSRKCRRSRPAVLCRDRTRKVQHAARTHKFSTPPPRHFIKNRRSCPVRYRSAACCGESRWHRIVPAGAAPMAHMSAGLCRTRGQCRNFVAEMLRCTGLLFATGSAAEPVVSGEQRKPTRFLPSPNLFGRCGNAGPEASRTMSCRVVAAQHATVNHAHRTVCYTRA